MLVYLCKCCLKIITVAAICVYLKYVSGLLVWKYFLQKVNEGSILLLILPRPSLPPPPPPVKHLGIFQNIILVTDGYFPKLCKMILLDYEPIENRVHLWRNDTRLPPFFSHSCTPKLRRIWKQIGEIKKLLCKLFFFGQKPITNMGTF